MNSVLVSAFGLIRLTGILPAGSSGNAAVINGRPLRLAMNNAMGCGGDTAHGRLNLAVRILPVRSPSPGVKARCSAKTRNFGKYTTLINAFAKSPTSVNALAGNGIGYPCRERMVWKPNQLIVSRLQMLSREGMSIQTRLTGQPPQCNATGSSNCSPRRAAAHYVQRVES